MFSTISLKPLHVHALKNRMVENYFITMKFLARLHFDIGHLLNIVMNSS